MALAQISEVPARSAASAPPGVPAGIPAEFGALFSNEHLAHELVMDPAFALKRAPRSPLEDQIAAIAKRAFVDAVRDQVARGVLSGHVVGIIADIKASLLAMVAKDSKTSLEIDAAIDMELILQEIAHDAFDLQRCLAYIGAKMLQLCAPMRDPAIRSLLAEHDAATVLIRMLDILDDMKLDLSNFRLQSIRPHLERHAVEYERDKFEKALAAGTASLDRTAAWLKAAVDSLESVAAARNPENIAHPESRLRFEDVYNAALLGLVFASTPANPASIAETLVMDAARIFGFQNDAQAVTIVAALLMLTKNIVPDLRTDNAALADLKDKLVILLKDQGTNVDNLALQIITSINDAFARKAARLRDLARASPVATPDAQRLSQDQEGLIKNMVDKTLSYKDPVFTLLSRRVQAAVRQHMERGSFRRDALASHGLDLVGPELEDLSTRIVLLARHNKAVFAKHYDDSLRTFIH
nr:T-complex protein 11 [Polyrhizophydium stewartii]